MSDYPAGGIQFRGDLDRWVQESPDVEAQMIGRAVCPPVPVNLKEGQFPKLTSGNFGLQGAVSQPRAAGTPGPLANRSIDRDTYSCTEYWLTDVVDMSWQEYFANRYGSLSLEQATSIVNSRNLLLGYEQRVAALYQSTANFSTETIVASYINANQTTTGANPIVDIENAYGTVMANGYNPDTIILTFNIFKYITSNPNFLNYYKPFGVNAPGQIPDLNAVKKAFEGLGIQQVYIAFSQINTSNTPGKVTLSPAWSDSYIWVGKKGNGNVMGGAGGAVAGFYWSARGSFLQNESWYDKDLDATKIRTRMYETEKLLDTRAGLLIPTGYTGS